MPKAMRFNSGLKKNKTWNQNYFIY